MCGCHTIVGIVWVGDAIRYMEVFVSLMCMWFAAHVCMYLCGYRTGGEQVFRGKYSTKMDLLIIKKAYPGTHSNCTTTANTKTGTFALH